MGALCLHELRARRLDGSLALSHAAADVGQVDLPERLPGAHPAALTHHQREQRASRLGAHHGTLRGDKRAGELQLQRQARQRGLHHLSGRELERGLDLGRVLGAEGDPGHLGGAQRRRHHQQTHPAQPPGLVHVVPLQSRSCEAAPV
ncbi:hypothetical protein [Piscinibacter sp.]|uniref:hypothetical protein n=1 Tax=Piscinibacter sp. TaxID=1903157 RepID=UPI0025EA334C|nr:hypothetical protein [Piscinibacter sp.]